MAIDGPRGPLDDPRERRTDRQPDPFPRRTAGDRTPDAEGVPDDRSRSDAERLAEATDGVTTQAAEQDRRRQADRDRQRRADLQRQRQRQQDQRRADDDRQRTEDEQPRAQDEQQRQAEQERERATEQQVEQQVEQDRAREEEDEPDRDPAVDPASVAVPAVAAAAATAEAEREPNTLADRPSDIEAALDPDAYRRWQEPGVVPTREELDQALNGGPDDLDAAGPAAAAQVGVDPDGQSERGQDGPEEDYAGRHRSEDGPEADREEGGRHRDLDDRVPEQEHWAPPAADARVDRDASERPTAERDREPDAERDSQTRQGGAAPARDAANQQQSQRSAETGRTVAAGGLAAGGKVVGSADNLVEAASPTGRPAQSQNWGIGRHQKPGDQALRKAMSAAMSGNARASDAGRAPERAPQATPHSGAHTPGQFHQRLQQQHQQEQHQQRGG